MAEATERVVERTVRTLQLGQFFRSCQWAVTNTANTQIAMMLCGGDCASKRALTLSLPSC